MRRRWQTLNFTLCLMVFPALLAPGSAVAQEEKVERAIKEAKPAAPPSPNAADAADPAKPGDAPKEETEVPRAEIAPVNPKLIMLYLQDGSVITGEMAINEISVATEFGTLEVPLDKIRSISPGLSSSPELAAKVNGLIEALGGDDYKAREQAHKDLSAMGLKVHKLLEQYRNDENTERKRHIGEILKEFEELLSQQDEEDGALADKPLIAQDTIVTDNFTIVGKISPGEFKVSSKYGPLAVQLADLKRAERPRNIKEAIRKTVQVPGDNLVQRSFKNSGIKVEAGDKISIRADGSVVMSPWGSDQSSGPDGAANYGWYIPNQIYGGALVAKIGDKGTVFKVGSKSTFVAKTSGTLHFAMAMQHQYAQQGYSYPGNYNVKVTVEGQ